MKKRTVGFVGVGNIGTPMVLSLLRDGFDVLIRDLRRDQAAECLAAGARFSENNQQLVDECELIGIAVVNDQQLNALFRSEGGLLDLATNNHTLVVHSTVLPDTIRELGEETDKRGIKLVDAQISGGDLRAREGDLAIMAGGDEADIEANRDYFDALSRRTDYMGPRGSGAATKIAIQMMTFGNWTAAIESMRLARALGLDEARLAAFATDTTANSWIVETWGNFDRLMHTHPMAGTDGLYRLFDKDLYNAVVVARGEGVMLPVTAVASQLLAEGMRERAEVSADTYGQPTAKVRSA